MESLIQRGVSPQKMIEIAMPVAEWIYSCDNKFFRSVEFNFARDLQKESVCEACLDVTFFYTDTKAERGYHNASIVMYTFDSEQRLNQKKEFIQKALQAKSIEELSDFVRQANEYPE